MNIEILEFYPLKEDKKNNMISGTLRVRLLDFGIHLLGVIAIRKKGKWYFQIPSKKSFDTKQKKDVMYPLVSFEDKQKMIDLFGSLQKNASEFIEKRLNDPVNPIIFKSKKQFPKKKEFNKKPAFPKPMDAVKTAKLVWSDPPPRKFNRK